MFLRRFERRKNGKPHFYWALVESYRTAKGSRQRVVAYLGELKAAEQIGWAKLGSHLGGEAKARRPQLSLFDPPRRDEPRDDEPLLVKLRQASKSSSSPAATARRRSSLLAAPIAARKNRRCTKSSRRGSKRA